MKDTAYKALLQKRGEIGGKEYALRNEVNREKASCFSFEPDYLEAETVYSVKVKAELNKKKGSEWSRGAEFTTPHFIECSSWKECPEYVEEERKYFIDKENPTVATHTSYDHRINHCTVTGNTALPLNKVTSWSVKVLNFKRNRGVSAYVGVAPFDINQNEDFNFNRCGWYFHCFTSTLCSGHPHNYTLKAYGPKMKGESVGVVMDTAKGDLSFVVDGINFGIAFERIPLDKPLVPCVILGHTGDSVELDTTEVREKEREKENVSQEGRCIIS